MLDHQSGEKIKIKKLIDTIELNLLKFNNPTSERSLSSIKKLMEFKSLIELDASSAGDQLLTMKNHQNGSPFLTGERHVLELGDGALVNGVLKQTFPLKDQAGTTRFTLRLTNGISEAEIRLSAEARS